ncbi:hypothetical protein A2757_01385 [Candidatus Giovannonibacteria bacterium RIFCSPHIGHO2_01_FULL_48_47]|nr:MAG: hypothetical protein A2757_01385 [Candidatus Giovannonibacteria bacterium RIFCSPHIGHO2_01_FULL_48_47]OGF68382.1 MAG: hypothetical protein A3D61_00675 [Candidatus Giovannonibacteria bacterium RIFCSPHIGHO2_02_FULL_48_15]OGF89683.1 MAG: hypothetical protein A3B26_01510 [Candidatus Giovannonibacteria bacterium RIFCSPLOWO2_01_FULL_48_47]OGF95474.1 MAG: hypothetical protein A2433_00030 [Candidatus Giovannonibacteria bacterium RIFOXYC1_FULL_48_8]OGF96164.1 MAG: hypothetical protein A2613_01180
MKFEDINVGYETEPVLCSFSEEDIKAFAKLSGDQSPLHLDDGFARTKGYKGRLAHGLLVASKFSYLVGMVIPGKDSLYLSQNLNFHRPILAGEKFKVKGTVVSKSESTKIVEIKMEIFDSEGRVAVEGRALVKII